MNGLDFLAIVGVALVLWGGYKLCRHLDQLEEWREEGERRLRERARVAAEIEGVPVDWLEALDSIRYLPETPYDWEEGVAA